jgi:hypothetical protein
MNKKGIIEMKQYTTGQNKYFQLDTLTEKK